MNDLDRHFFQFQLQLLQLDLQLAEVEEKPKRSGNFETIYKTKSGEEVSVKRSPDGKFASKSSTPSTATSDTKIAPTLDPKVARENGQAVREVLTGKVGDDLKKDLAADFKHRPDIQQAIERVDLAEITKGDKDALSNINDFMKKTFEKAVNAASQSAQETLAVGIAVANHIARSLLGWAALGGTLILGGIGYETFTKGTRLDRATALVATEVAKDWFSDKRVGRIAKRAAIFELIFQAIRLARHQQGKSDPPLVEPETDKVIKDSLSGDVGTQIKSGLVVGAANFPSIAEGIKNTKIDDVIKGTKDTFGNAVDFMHSQIDKAASAVSEHQEELAIGATVVASTVIGSMIGLAIAATATAVIGDSVGSLIAGKGLLEAAKLGLKNMSVGRTTKLLSDAEFISRLVAGLLVFDSVRSVKKRVQEVRTKELDIQDFADKTGAINEATVIGEGIDQEKLLKALARSKNQIPDPKKAEQIQKEIFTVQGKIEDGARKAKEIVSGKSSFTVADTIELVAIAKKETELRNILIAKKGELATAEGRGFSLRKRVDELLEIEKAKGKQSPSYKWRANIVKAEIEYGERLDSLDTAKGYEELLDAMKKPTSAPGKYTSISASDSAKLYSFFLENMSTPKTPLEKQEEVIKRAKESGLSLQDYLSTPIVAQIGLEGGMTCAIPGGNNKYSEITKDIARGSSLFEPLIQTETFNDKKIDGFINIGDAVVEFGGQRLQGYNASASTDEHIREMMWHESGHLLEVKLGKVEESVAFREERASEVPADRKEVPPQGISLGSQDFALGDFYSPYIGLRMKGQGKYEEQDTATEVLSSGMELLSSPVLAKRGVKADRETMLYALAAMNEKLKD